MYGQTIHTLHVKAKRKIRPGHLPLPHPEVPRPPSPFAELFPPFIGKSEQEQIKAEQARQRALELEGPRIQRDRKFAELRKAREKVRRAAGEVRDAVFLEWIERCLERAEVPTEWTQARTLYANYLKHAKTIAQNRAQRREVVMELATETLWGKMMATLFTKKRRTAGWYYPLRCKKG